ncbi:hypothetical protein ACWD1W_38330, partial [Streptomyces olivaceoviridis]
HRVCVARSEAASRARRRGGGGSEHSAGPQIAEFREADAGQCVEKVGLCGTNTLGRSLRAGAMGAAAGHGDHRTAGARRDQTSALSSGFFG